MHLYYGSVDSYNPVAMEDFTSGYGKQMEGIGNLPVYSKYIAMYNILASV